MTTSLPQDWAVTTATERLATDDQGRADVTFTVTNLKDVAGQAIVTVTTEVDEARSWFTVTDPVRSIDAGSSVPVVVKIQVPPTASTTTYAFAAAVHPADEAPEETIVHSNRVLLTITPRSTTPRRPRVGRRLILIAAAGVAVALLIIAAVLVLVRPSGPPPQTAAPSAPTPIRGGLVPVPDVLGQGDVEAVSALISERGLVPIIRYRFVSVGGRVSSQRPEPNVLATVGDMVLVTYDVAISPPADITVSTRTQPQRLFLPMGTPATRLFVDVTVSWSQAETFVRTWQVMFFDSVCFVYEVNRPPRVTGPLATGVAVVHVRQVRVTRVYTPRPTEPSVPYNCPQDPERVYVAPVDDFGTLGPVSEARVVSP
jgi:hypothetical protein